MVNLPLTTNNKKNLIKINIRAIAKAIGKSPTWVSLVLNGHRKGIPTRKAIAEALGVSYEDLWGKEDK